MRHCKKTIKLGRKSEHRNLLLANQVCSLIEHSRIETTLAKANAVRPFAEKMITLGKRGDLRGQPSIKRRDGDRRLTPPLFPASRWWLLLRSLPRSRGQPERRNDFEAGLMDSSRKWIANGLRFKCNRHLLRQLAPLVPSYQALLTTAAEPVRQSQRILHKCSSASTRLAAHCSTQAPVQIQKSTFCDLRA